MKKNFFIKSRLVFIAIFLLVIFALNSSYYVARNVYQNVRVKKIEELCNQNSSSDSYIKTFHSGAYTFDTDNSQDFVAASKFFFLAGKKTLVVFCVLTLIMSLFQFYLYIRNWMIQVSQSRNRIFLVHYQKLKDGKKSAPSNCYSF